MPNIVRIKRTFGYPVIETALHTGDCAHCLEDYVASYGGNALVDEWRAAERASRLRAAPHPPLREDLFCEQRADQGWDHSVLLPGNALAGLAVADIGRRGTLQRAINHYHADVWYKHRAHVTPVAGIPLHTPAAGIAHLEFAVKRLRFKAITLSSCAQAAAGDDDHDPFWRKVVELGVPVLLDCAGAPDPLGGGEGLASFARALLFGRVTRRFPGLRVGLLDGGSGWRRRICTEIALGGADREQLAESLYFGLDSAELGDPTVHDDHLFGVRINAICTSHDGRVSPRTANRGLEAGWRLVEDGAIDEDDLRAYVYTNPYRLYGDANADFFTGTAVQHP
jgi:hypothetical protein